MPRAPTIVSELPSTSPHVERGVGLLDGFPGAVEVWRLPNEAPESWRALFELEAEELGRLSHPALARALEVGELEGRPYLITNLRERGSSLFDLWSEDSFGLGDRCRVIQDLAAIWADAHQKEISLGEVMPGLIFWNPRSRVLSVAHHRAPGVVLRIPSVAPLPEEPGMATSFRPQKDVARWAFFAVWLLQRSEDVDQVFPDLEGRLSPEFFQLLRSCLSSQGAIRPQDMGEVSEALKGMGRLFSPEARPPSPALSEVFPAETRGPSQGKSPMVVRSAAEGLTPRQGASAVAVCLGVMGWFLWSQSGPTPVAPRPPTLVSGEGMVPIHHPRVGDPYLHFLLKQEKVDPDHFRQIMAMIESLAVKERLPREIRDPSRLAAIRQRFDQDPEAACRLLDGVLSELRSLLVGEPAKSSSD